MTLPQGGHQSAARRAAVGCRQDGVPAEVLGPRHCPLGRQALFETRVPTT